MENQEFKDSSNDIPSEYNGQLNEQSTVKKRYGTTDCATGVQPRIGAERQPEVKVENNIKMKKQIGLAGGVAFIVGTQIGSGIFISPTGVMSASGSVAVSLLVWAGCGIIAMCGALSFAELGTMIPRSGAEFSYLLEAFGSIPAYLSVWTGIVISKTSSQAIICLSFAHYVLTPLFDDCGPPELLLKLLAAATIVTITVINCYSAKLAARIQVLFLVVKLAALLVIIIGGLIKLGQGNTKYLAEGFKDTTADASLIALAFYDGLWAYDGWNNLNYMTEELVNPNVNLPRSILIGIPLVTIVYLLTNVSYLTVMSKEMLLASPAVAVAWGDRVLGAASAAIPIAVAFSTFGAANGSCFGGSRLCYAAAREGHFPGILSHVHVNKYTPITSLIFTTAISLLMIIPGDISSLIDFFSFTAWLIYGATFLSVIVMRFTRKDWKRPYKVPIILPVFALLVSIYLVIAPIVQDPKIEFLYAALFVFGGLIFYVPFVHFKIKLGCVDALTMFMQLFLQVGPSKLDEQLQH